MVMIAARVVLFSRVQSALTSFRRVFGVSVHVRALLLTEFRRTFEATFLFFFTLQFAFVLLP